VAQELHLAVVEQLLVRDGPEERCESYAFLRQSGTQHGNLKVDLQNDFTTGDNRYPNNRQQTLHVRRYVQQDHGCPCNPVCGRCGGRDGASEKSEVSNTYDKKWWKNKECYKYHKKGHPSTHCPKKSVKDNNDKFLESTSSSVDKIKKDL
jgi:hypothetical protein